MKRFTIVTLAIASLLCSSCLIGTNIGGHTATGKIIDHADANVTGLTPAQVAAVKAELVVAYWHTSHGSQLTNGVSGMDTFYASRGWSTGTFTLNGVGGLSIDERSPDVGAFGSSGVANSAALFRDEVRTYLGSHPDTNVVMASWCGQVSGSSASDISAYLARIAELETEYPNVVFVYMTGHSDGTGLTGNLHLRNQQIRDYCVANNKWLYDFYDIECYDPDGVYFGDRNVDDACNYNGGNWSNEWTAEHPTEYWTCPSDGHTTDLNRNQKAKAVWQLWCSIAAEM